MKLTEDLDMRETTERRKPQRIEESLMISIQNAKRLQIQFAAEDNQTRTRQSRENCSGRNTVCRSVLYFGEWRSSKANKRKMLPLRSHTPLASFRPLRRKSTSE